MDRPNNATQPWLLEFLLLAAIWGASFMFMRLAVVDFGSLATAALRAGIGGLSLLPVLFWRREAMQAMRRWKALFAAGVLSAAIPSACLSFALLSISSGLTSIMNATAPLFGAVLAFFWLGQRLHRPAVLGLLIGFGGVAMLIWSRAGVATGAHAFGATVAMFSAAMAALSGACSALFARRHLADLPPVVVAAGSQVGAAIGLGVPAALYWPAAGAGLQAWLAVAAAGVLCTGVGYLLFFRVIQRAGPTRAMTVTFLMPLFAMGYGSLFLQERVTPAMAASAALIIGGTSLSILRR